MKRMGIVLVGIVLVIGCIFLFNQKDTKEILITEEQELDNTSLVFMLQDEEGNYDKSDTLPSTGYTLNASKSVCSDNATPTWEDNKLYINNLTKKGTSCYLYFDKKPMAMNTILANKEIRTRSDFSTTITETTTGVIYASLDETQYDNDGKVYYFAGNPTDNWVRFGGFYWRIIRVNGDGSIRLIYSGDSSSGPVTTGKETQIGTSAFNEQYNDNAYVGYMYGSTGQSSYAPTHANNNSSTIKIILDNWYQNNLLSYSTYISVKTEFCGDRQPSTSSSTSNGSGGTGTTETYYGAYIRLQTNRIPPTFKCNNLNDLYTINSSTKGNKVLDYPIGLITADEVAYAGSRMSTTENIYNTFLNTEQTYWTITPHRFMTAAELLYVSLYGSLVWTLPTFSAGVRPVINLDANVTLSGSGTSTDPYVVEGAM